MPVDAFAAMKVMDHSVVTRWERKKARTNEEKHTDRCKNRCCCFLTHPACGLRNAVANRAVATLRRLELHLRARRYLVVCLSFSFYWLSFDGTESLSPEAAGGAHRSVPVGFLACFRCCVAVLHLCTLVVIASDRTFNVVTDYYNVKLGSALKKERIEMSGLERCAAFFTVWTYAAQGASFALAATQRPRIGSIDLRFVSLRSTPKVSSNFYRVF